MKTFAVAVMLLALCSPLHSQNRVVFTLNPGTSLYNSEELMKTSGGKSIGWSPGLGVGYERDSVWGMTLRIEYNFTSSNVTDVLRFVRTSSSGPEVLGTFGADLVLSVHNIDLAVCGRVTDWLSLGIGPTVALVDRTIEIDNLSTLTGGTDKFKDRLVSWCAGANGSINFHILFPESPAFIASSLKLRYLHSLWFDKRGRNLENYYQSFLIGQINIGCGYSF